MSGFSTGGGRGAQAKAPEKGVFPLDHFGECKTLQQEYLACLKDHKGKAEACQPVAQTYLQCRMARNLMAKQDLQDLGFRDAQSSDIAQSGSAQADEDPRLRPVGSVAAICSSCGLSQEQLWRQGAGRLPAHFSSKARLPSWSPSSSSLVAEHAAAGCMEKSVQQMLEK
ncbi:hypothetical protein WJX73_002903 [Symbiochloris irregularis]|uniref:Cytochrome c oxidase assembly protein COX19 n=1 Tax=Symbiochloris irregularis TaxID=706552 RepID=A0AAW1PA66_9CHLO